MKDKVGLTSLSIIVIILMIFGTGVLAVSNSDLSDINNRINGIKEDISNIKKDQTSTLTEISKLTSQISEYQNQIEDMEKEIKEMQTSIAEKTKELAQKEEMYEDNYQKMITRLIAVYKNGNITYLDAMLSSKSISEFASSWHYLSVITEADLNFLDVTQKAKLAIENMKISLEDDKQKLEAKKKNVQSTSNALKQVQIEKQNHMVNLNEEEKELQKELDRFERDKKEIERKLAEIAARENRVITGTPSSHGYIFPVAGLSRGAINNMSYPSYPGHTGTDININVMGRSVVAVKSGTVEISTAIYGSIRNYDANGNYIASYSSYGEYIVINHHDGTMTLYGHLKPGSRRVSAGQKVSQGQVIATVGNTGNCMPRPTPSSPTNGTHLHFEVRINGRCVNPVPYLP